MIFGWLRVKASVCWAGLVLIFLLLFYQLPLRVVKGNLHVSVELVKLGLLGKFSSYYSFVELHLKLF